MQVQESSVDWVIASGDEAGRIRAEEESQRCDFRRLPHPTDGLHLRQLLHHCLLAPGIVLVEKAIHERCVYARRRDAIAADIVTDIVARDGIGHGQHRTLAHRIGKSIGEARDRGYGGKVQNHAASGCLHVVDGGVHAVVNALYVNAEDAFEVVIGSALQLANVGDSCIVDKDLNRTAAADLAEDILHLLLIGDVAQVPLCCAALAANCRRSFLGMLLIYFEDVNRGAGLREADCDRLSDAACAPSDDRGFAVQPKSRRVVAVCVQRETPLFQGMKSSCPSNSALVFTSPLATLTMNSKMRSPASSTDSSPAMIAPVSMSMASDIRCAS